MDLESDLDHAPLRASVRSLEAHFQSDAARALAPLRNPHHEPRVDKRTRESATAAAVLIPIVDQLSGLSVLLTRRHHAISFPGQIAFPGGRADSGDASPEHTALRESEEEIALSRERVRVLGRLGEYVSHSGFRIAPVVGLVTPPLDLRPAVGEVEEILEIPLDYVLDARSYRLRELPGATPRAHFYLDYEGRIVTGLTVSLLIGFYEELRKTHPVAAG